MRFCQLDSERLKGEELRAQVEDGGVRRIDARNTEVFRFLMFRFLACRN